MSQNLPIQLRIRFYSEWMSLTKKKERWKYEKNKRDHAIIKTFYYTQLRRNEIINLNIEDVDFQRYKIRINEWKGNQYAEINIHPVALKSVKRYLESRDILKDGHRQALFLNYKGERLGYMSMGLIVKGAGAKAGITKNIYPHLFRASAKSVTFET